MEPDQNSLSPLVAGITAQLRGALSNLHLASAQLAPAADRERDDALDARAALLDQSYYRMLRLVNELSAALYAFEEGPLPLQDRDIVELVSRICEESGSLAPLLGLELRFLCAMDRHVCAVAPDAMEQLLFQLLSNAFKATPPGGIITVELRRSGRQLLLSVSDTGRGIEPERLPRLFESVLCGEQPQLLQRGLGIGLPLCKKIAQRQGGMLLAESRLGKGSRFTLSLPDRRAGTTVSDVPFDYTGGFSRTLLALADALPVEAFCLRSQE